MSRRIRATFAWVWIALFFGPGCGGQPEGPPVESASIDQASFDLGHHRRLTWLMFKDATCFAVDYSAYPVIAFTGADDGAEYPTISHLGRSKLSWTIKVIPDSTGALQFVSGDFSITGANQKDRLVGFYSAFEIDAQGNYVLDWRFTDGAGRFSDARGRGRTHGQADLTTGCAKYAFFGFVWSPRRR